MKTPHNPAILLKPNPLVVATGILTTNEKKLFNTVLNIIARKDSKEKDKLRWNVSYKELKEMSGLPSNQRIKEAFRGLKNADIKIYDILLKQEKGKAPKSYKNFECKYISAFAEDTNGENYFVEITQTLYDFLQEKNIAEQIDLKIAKQITSKHALWLYEIINSYQGISNITLTIEKVRILAGLKEKQYSKISDLTHYVIKKAVKEIKKNTKWDIEFETIKSGRNIIAFKFVFSNKMRDENNKKRLFRLWLQNYLFDTTMSIEKIDIGFFQYQSKKSNKVLLFSPQTKQPFPKEEAEKQYEKLYKARENIFVHVKNHSKLKNELVGLKNIDQALIEFNKAIKMQEEL